MLKNASKLYHKNDQKSLIVSPTNTHIQRNIASHYSISAAENDLCNPDGAAVVGQVL